MNKDKLDINYRLIQIDALRGLAVLFMMVQHLTVWLWAERIVSLKITAGKNIILASFLLLGNVAAPLFISLAGMGTVFLAKKSNRPGSLLIRRGLAIMTVGFILNLMTPHWFRPMSWYVLHLIGFCLILSPLLLRFRIKTLLIISLISLLLSAFYHSAAKTGLFLTSSDMNQYSNFLQYLRMIFFSGHLPVLPWSAFFMLGIIAARLYLNKKSILLVPFALFMIIPALILNGLYSYGYYFATGGYFFRFFVLLPYIYPLLPPLALILAGLIALLIFIGLKLNNNILTESLSYCGRISLTIFFVHIVIFLELFHKVGLHRIFSDLQSLLIILITITLAMIIARIWSVAKYRYSLEWLIRKYTK